MKMFDRHIFSRRSLLRGTTASLAAAGLGVLGKTASASTRKKSEGGDQSCDGEILGQGDFRYRAHRHCGLLERAHYPVKDCHGITEDRNGRVVLLTNDTHNNLIAYAKPGNFITAWENRFPAARVGFDFVCQEHLSAWHELQDLQLPVARGSGRLRPAIFGDTQQVDLSRSR